MSEDGTDHCPNCRQSYDGYHKCSEGVDRVEFTCIDCSEHVNRETHHMDVKGLAPRRCSTCVLAKMGGLR